MTKNLFFFLATMLLFTFYSCGEDDMIIDPVTPSNSINTILPLGASRVEGARPVFESYRYDLWKQLNDGGYTFDFIGTRQDEGSYPNHTGLAFDLDHEGRGGWTSGQILNGINDWLDATGAPDIVLFSSPGGNDALQNLSYTDAISNINAIIDALQAKNPNVTILIEQMAPARSDAMTPQLSTYFTQMQSDVVTIATNQSTSTSRVIPVDMFTGFTDTFCADEVHYNEEGAAFIATRYYEALTDILE